MRTRPALVRAMTGLGLGVLTGVVAGFATPPPRPPAASTGSDTSDTGEDGDE